MPQSKQRPTVFDGDPPEMILARHPKARIKLIDARIQRGLSRPQLARRLSIPRTNVFSVEMGITNPGFETMLHWARELECSLEIFDPEAPPKRNRVRKAPRAIAHAAE